MNTIRSSHTLLLSTLLLLTVPLSAHSYERGALAPKDPPLMPTVIVYSGETASPEPSSSEPAAPTANSISPEPTISAVPATPASSPAPQTLPDRPAAIPTMTAPTTRSSQGSTAKPEQASESISAVATPASRSEARRHFIQLILLLTVLGISASLIWWYRRPYTPPHVRQKSDKAKNYDIDLDLDR